MTSETINYYQKLSQLPRPHEEVPFPVALQDGTTFDIPMWILTAQEDYQVSAGAEKEVRKLLAGTDIDIKSRGYNDLYNDQCAYQLLWFACRCPGDVTKPFFLKKEDLPALLNSDQIGILLNHYYDLKLGQPSLKHITSQAELDEWIKKIQNGGKDVNFLLNSFSLVSLKTLIFSLVNQSQNLLKDNASASSQPNDTSNPSEEKMETIVVPTL